MPAIKGCTPWNKNKKFVHSGTFKKGHPGYFKGKKFSEDHKQKIREAMLGDKNHQWKGGRISLDKGYVRIYKPDHPYCDNHGYVLEHRLVVEKNIGRYLTPNEVIHHKGRKYPMGSIENRHDNHIDNLEIFFREDHSKFHATNKGITPMLNITF